MKNGIIAAAATLAFLSTEAEARNADDARPFFKGEVLFEIEHNGTFKSDDPASEINDLFPTIEGAFDVRLGNYLTTHTDLIIEPVLDAADDRYFEDIGLYAETLFLRFDKGPFTLLAGKFNPTFGTAWDITPGVFGVDFAEDYELTEQIGFAGAVKFGAEGSGVHTLQGNLFFADTTFLSESTFTNRGRVRRRDGGASNTESLESFSVTVDGSAFGSLPGFSYNVGFAHLATGFGDVDDENAFVAGVQQNIELSPDSRLQFVGEAAHLSNAGGGANDATYVTAGGGYTYGQWNAALSGTWRHIDVTGGDNIDDFLIQASGGYEFENGFSFNVAYKFTEEADIENHTIGVVLSRTFNFSR